MMIGIFFLVMETRLRSGRWGRLRCLTMHVLPQFERGNRRERGDNRNTTHFQVLFQSVLRNVKSRESAVKSKPRLQRLLKKDSIFSMTVTLRHRHIGARVNTREGRDGVVVNMIRGQYTHQSIIGVEAGCTREQSLYEFSKPNVFFCGESFSEV